MPVYGRTPYGKNVYDAGYSDLEVVATPVITPKEGYYDRGIVVDITTPTEGATIYYTLDGREPNENSIKYEGPFTLKKGVYIVKARAYKQNYGPSASVTAAFTIAARLPKPREYGVLLNIQGVDCTHYIVPGSLTHEAAINERDTLTFELIAPVGELEILEGQQVYLSYVTRVFGGTIETVEESRVGMVEGYIHYKVECADWHQILDRRIVAKSYVDTTVDAIIDDILENYLADEGIVIDFLGHESFLAPTFPQKTGGRQTVIPEVHVSEAVFNYVSAAEVFERMAERTGCNWWIDADKRLHFIEREEYKAPWNITPKSPVRDIRVNRNREEYRNKQYVKGGKAETEERTERFRGDGETRTFTLGFPLAKEPIVKVNGQLQTVGVRGVDEGKQWYWAQGEKTLTQDNNEYILIENDILEVTYQGLFDVVVIVPKEDEIENRKAIEGGTGIYEQVETADELTTLNGILDLAVDKLRKFAKTQKTISFLTFRAGLRPGQIIKVDLPEHKIHDEEFLITHTTFADVDGSGIYSWSVEAVSGEALGGWTQFFKKLVKRSEPFIFTENINEQETVIIIEQFLKEWQEEEHLNPFYELYPGANTFPGINTYPMFEPGEWGKYVALFNGDEEVARAQRVQQIKNGDSVSSMYMIGATVYAGPITAIGWYGGYFATDDLGTGVEITKEPLSRVKTPLDVLQIERTDVKGW